MRYSAASHRLQRDFAPIPGERRMRGSATLFIFLMLLVASACSEQNTGANSATSCTGVPSKVDIASAIQPSVGGGQIIATDGCDIYYGQSHVDANGKRARSMRVTRFHLIKEIDGTWFALAGPMDSGNAVQIEIAH